MKSGYPELMLFNHTNQRHLRAIHQELPQKNTRYVNRVSNTKRYVTFSALTSRNFAL